DCTAEAPVDAHAGLHHRGEHRTLDHSRRHDVPGIGEDEDAAIPVAPAERFRPLALTHLYHRSSCLIAATRCAESMHNKIARVVTTREGPHTSCAPNQGVVAKWPSGAKFGTS